MEQSLADLKILDVTHYIAGPFCTKLLADYGAQVIKMEKPDEGDPARRLGPFPGDKPDPEASGLFLYLNANKRSVTLDLKTSSGAGIFKELVRQVDVVVENFEPRVMPSLGLDYATLERINPKLVMTSISNFGQTGPYRDFKATEIVESAMSGIMYKTGPYETPMKQGDSPMQFMAGLIGAVATMTAVWAVREYGIGQHVDVSIMESVPGGTHNSDFMQYPYMGVVAGRAGRVPEFGRIAIPCQDGYVIPFFLATMRATWDDFALAAGVPELSNEKFQTSRGRIDNAAELIDLLIKGWKDKTKKELFEAGQLFRLLLGPVQDAAEVVECPQLDARQFFVEIDHPRTGKMKYPGAPFKMSETPYQVRARAPLLGEHNEEIRAEYLAHPKAETPRVEVTQGHTTKQEQGEMPALPLGGIRILDSTYYMNGPFGTRLLADMGAEVIHVESCSHPDGTRLLSDYCPDNRPTADFFNHTHPFNLLNYNKLGLTLELSRPEGRELFLELVKISDVVAENWSPRVMKNLGLDYPNLKKVKPDIIMLSSSGYGHTGPYTDDVGNAYKVEAMSGHLGITGYPGKPIRAGTIGPDFLGGISGAFAILAALHYHKRTGKGQWIDLPLYEITVATLPDMVMDYVMNGRVQSGIGNRDAHMAPHGCYRCQGDDNWVVIAVGTNEDWQSLCQVMGNAALANDGRFSAAINRRQHQDELDPVIEEWTIRRDSYEVMHELQSAGIPAAPVLNTKQIWLDPHLKARGFFKAVTQAAETEGHKVVRPYPGVLWKMSKTPGGIRSPAPTLGQHNEYVLGQLLGKSKDEINRLRTERVVGEALFRHQPPNPLPIDVLLQHGLLRGYDANYLEILSKALEMELH